MNGGVLGKPYWCLPPMNPASICRTHIVSPTDVRMGAAGERCDAQLEVGTEDRRVVLSQSGVSP